MTIPSSENGTIRILVVEDDANFRQLLVEEMLDIGFNVQSATNVERASDKLHKWRPDIVISDLRLPGGDGFDLLRLSKDLSPAPSFIVITGFGTVAQAVDALRQGAEDFLTKPLDFDHLRLSVLRVRDRRRLQMQVALYQKAFQEGGYHGLIGQSKAMQDLFTQIQRVAGGEGPVLITGESGSGKELVARAIHAESSRSQGKFVAVNCAGIPESLIESEFFGHAAGAFTGASKSRRGLFVEASGGTLFLDEFAEMPLPLQVKLLRVLQEGAVRPVGFDSERKVDVRILAATNRNLEEDIHRGALREDFYYRLETFTIEVPPLREREDDIEILAARFLERFSLQAGKSINGFSPKALEALKKYPFPGNVRELQNAIERAVVFCDASSIKPDHLPPRIRRSESVAEPLPEGQEFHWDLFNNRTLPTLAELETRYIQYVVDKLDGNKRRAAAVLGIGRRTLYRRLGGDHEEDL